VQVDQVAAVRQKLVAREAMRFERIDDSQVLGQPIAQSGAAAETVENPSPDGQLH
jgi:hypothetical protein